MVRVNIIHPKYLSDQHLIAEYNEIMMLVGYMRKYPETSLDKIPAQYTLGKGHMLFFKDKIVYLQERHKIIVNEMKERGFRTNKSLSIAKLPAKLRKSWKPSKKDKKIIKSRIIWKLKNKPNFYRYKGEKRPLKYFLKIINEAS